MNILMTSIVDLKKSQHNRPHQLVRYLSKKHEINVLSINDWCRGGKPKMEFKDGLKKVHGWFMENRENINRSAEF